MDKREKITKSEWKLIINAGNPNFKDCAQAKLIRLSNMTYACGVKAVKQLIKDGIFEKIKIDCRSKRIKLTKLGIEVRDLILKL